MKVKVTQIKSGIGRPADQKRTLEALGLRKIRQSRVYELTAPIQGMIAKVSHLVEVEEIN
ncbi:MAG: 50S ribosomal protein L30 [Bacteroidales bacterium]|jgi:large subunit ribosomal protein L30|nr:50S ribosomal protein L30 [Bacteroidales bacterium]MBQ2375584.1 50S ribosomal protein L30 [Bacteroidales bacterium]MBQ2397646.1 50S ribosomal protein L30 [Bacteroidales bacterium]MBQ5873770.1 50S ribosomal protein L30 [Bacteroidales bacterium]MBQ5892287.1 50S ribosomal protein L30 [Bacteroidales bacterium]